MAARGLGKGLDSLIPNSVNLVNNNSINSNSSKSKEISITVKINMVEPNREQPRKKFDEDTLNELAASIKQFGLLQPIVVQDRKDHYEIIAGERRWRAAKLAGLKEIPVIIRNYTDQEILEISLIENIQRENLNPIEEALAYKRFIEEFHLKHDEIAERVSKSRTAITNSLRLLKLCEKVQQMLIKEMISMGHARALLAIEDDDEQYKLAQRICDEKLSVRDVEKIIRNINNNDNSVNIENNNINDNSNVNINGDNNVNSNIAINGDISSDFSDVPRETSENSEKYNQEIDERLQILYKDMEEKFRQKLGTKVAISPRKNGSGRIEIEFYSDDDLERILNLINETEY